jgi:hypothetical protein
MTSMNVSHACAQCGTIANPNDKFCNTCGAPVNRQPAGPSSPPYGGAAPQPQYAPPPAYGASPPAPGYGTAPPPQQQQQQQFGGSGGGAGAGPQRPSRCQMGHDIAPGASYCPQGHPIALDAMQFANEPYGGPPAQGAAQGPPFGAPQGYAPQGYPDPRQGFGAPPPQGYGAQPPPGFGGGPPQGAPPQGFAGAPQGQPPPGFGAPPQGYGLPAPPQQGFGAPQQQAAFQPAFQPPAAQYAPPPAPTGVPGLDPAAQLAPGAKLLRGFLVSYQSSASGDFWPLHGGRNTVGRANAGEPPDIPLADATISSRHAVLAVDAASGSIQVEDTNSTNGTYVNEEHIGMNGRRELRDGDRVRFGGFTTIVKVIGRI